MDVSISVRDIGCLSKSAELRSNADRWPSGFVRGASSRSADAKASTSLLSSEAYFIGKPESLRYRFTDSPVQKIRNISGLYPRSFFASYIPSRSLKKKKHILIYILVYFEYTVDNGLSSVTTASSFDLTTGKKETISLFFRSRFEIVIVIDKDPHKPNNGFEFCK